MPIRVPRLLPSEPPAMPSRCITTGILGIVGEANAIILGDVQNSLFQRPDGFCVARLLVSWAAMSTSEATSEQQVVQRFISGDDVAFRELCELYGPGLIVYLRSRLDSGAKKAAEDIAQETWLKVWRGRQRFDGRHFSGWLYQIGKNALRDYLRKESKQPESLSADRPVASSEIAASTRLELEEELAMLRECYETVGADFMRVYLAQLEGKSTGQIAESEGIDAGTVYSRLHRAKRKIRECVEQKLK